ncbi:MAG: hypothetical protein ACON5A_03650 [Candidatus Comchoanobacterales bacterium]
MKIVVPKLALVAAKIIAAVGAPIYAAYIFFVVENVLVDEEVQGAVLNKEPDSQQKTEDLVNIINAIDGAKEKIQQSKDEQTALENKEDPNKITNQAIMLLSGKGMEFSKQEDPLNQNVIVWRVKGFEDGSVMQIHPDIEKTQLKMIEDLDLFNHISENNALVTYLHNVKNIKTESYDPISNVRYDDDNQLLSWESNKASNNETWVNNDKRTAVILHHQHGDMVNNYKVSRWYFSDEYNSCWNGWNCEQGITHNGEDDTVSLDIILSQQAYEFNLEKKKFGKTNTLEFGEIANTPKADMKYHIWKCNLDNKNTIEEDWKSFMKGDLDEPYMSLVIGDSMLNVPLEYVEASFKYWVNGNDEKGTVSREVPLNQLENCANDYKITLSFPKDKIITNTDINEKWFLKNGNLTHAGKNKADPIKDFSLTIVY